MQKDKGGVRFVLINLIRLILAITLVAGYVQNRALVLTFSIIALVITFIPTLIEQIFNRRVPGVYEIVVILFVYGVLFYGEIRGFYDGFWWGDILLNLVAAIALGFVGFTVLYVLYREEAIDASPIILSLLVFCFAFAIAGLWELMEFAFDGLFGFNLQGGDLFDSMTDLIASALGALIVSISGYIHMKSGGRWAVSSFLLRILERNPKILRNKKYLESSSSFIEALTKKGESEKLEFKSTLRVNVHTGEFDKKIEHSVLKTLVAFMNSTGGTLLVGVSDSGEIKGLEKDGFGSNDKLNLYFGNLIKHRIGREFFDLVNYELFSVDDKHVLRVSCVESDEPVFLREGQEEEFFVRNGASTVKLSGSSLVKYINRKFGKH